MVEEGVLLERNTCGTLVLIARRFGLKRAFFSYKTERHLFSFVFATEEGPFGAETSYSEQVYHVYYTQEHSLFYHNQMW